MSRFNVNDIAYFNGSNKKGVVTQVREGAMATFYQLDGESVWTPERMLWDGNASEKTAFCSQLQCQRKLEIVNMVLGTHYVLDQYGFPMCKVHEDNEQWT